MLERYFSSMDMVMELRHCAISLLRRGRQPHQRGRAALRRAAIAEGDPRPRARGRRRSLERGARGIALTAAGRPFSIMCAGAAAGRCRGRSARPPRGRRSVPSRSAPWPARAGGAAGGAAHPARRAADIEITLAASHAGACRRVDARQGGCGVSPPRRMRPASRSSPWSGAADRGVAGRPSPGGAESVRLQDCARNLHLADPGGVALKAVIESYAARSGIVLSRN